MKGAGRVYQHTFVNTYAKVAFTKLSTTKTPIVAADLLNDRVLPFYQGHQVPLLRVLTDRGTEYCGKIEQHDHQLYLAVNDIDHTRTKIQSPQTNGIRERFHKTILNEFYQIAFRKKVYTTLESMQEDLDAWIDSYNHERTHRGKMCCSRTPITTPESHDHFHVPLVDSMQIETTSLHQSLITPGARHSSTNLPLIRLVHMSLQAQKCCL